MNNKLQYWIELNRVKLFYKICIELFYYLHLQSNKRPKYTLLLKTCDRRNDFFYFSLIELFWLCLDHISCYFSETKTVQDKTIIKKENKYDFLSMSINLWRKLKNWEVARILLKSSDEVSSFFVLNYSTKRKRPWRMSFKNFKNSISNSNLLQAPLIADFFWLLDLSCWCEQSARAVDFSPNEM